MIDAEIDPDNTIQQLVADLPKAHDGTTPLPLIRGGELVRLKKNLPGEGKAAPVVMGGRLLRSTGREVD